MKSAQKILALILAGVMALALLTGCGKSTSPDRAVAESVADYMKYTCSQEGNKNEISVSYQVPELRRDIVPLFDENWITYNKDHMVNDLNKNHMVNGKTVEATLTAILSPYQSAKEIVFVAADVTDVKTTFLKTNVLFGSSINFRIRNLSTFDGASITSLKIAVTHKTVNGRTYALAVYIEE